ncbi:MAG TPA: DUF6493 family protein [Chryseosolibacter sp.]|nr:DUF6493 family protein [Chryseosolibacter sp.]
MSHEQAFLQILKNEREQEMIPFFKGLPEEERAKLVPFLVDLCRDYLEYKENRSFGSLTFNRKATDKQASMLVHAAFICFNRKQFEKVVLVWMLDTKKVDEILEWYCPKWFGDYINREGEAAFLPTFLTYEWVVKISDRGLIHPTRELIVKALPQLLFETGKDRQWVARPSNLLKYPVTLRDHIWYFFEVENNLHNTDRFLHDANGTKKEQSHWMQALKQYSDEGRIDRSRLLKESMLASGRNFNKLQSGWATSLFSLLEPRKDELLSMQDALFSALNCPHSKPVNTALQAFKQIADDPQCNVDGLIEAAPVLMSSETKAIVKATLSLLDKIAKKHPGKREAICVIACQAFLISDDEVQTRAAKLIQKHGDENSAAIAEAVASYREPMLVSVKKLLSPFIKEDANRNTRALELVPVEISQQRVHIPFPDSPDELVFLASQAFDNNQPYHLDLLPAALIRMNERVPEIADKFTPALQRALKLCLEGFTTTTGHLDHLLAVFFVDYCKLLIKRNPEQTTALSALQSEFLKKEGETRPAWMQPRIHSLVSWATSSRDPIYKAHKELLLLALTRLEKNETLPLLSTPTHEPAYVAPDVLINRLKLYQEKNHEPDTTDFHVAISRCDLSESKKFLDLARSSLQGEIGNLVQFLMDRDGRPQPPFSLHATWVLTAATKDRDHIPGEIMNLTSMPINYLNGKFSWHHEMETYTVGEYDQKRRKYVQVKKQRPILIVDFNEKSYQPRDSIRGFLSRMFAAKKQSRPGIYESIVFRNQYNIAAGRDMARLICLMPNNVEPMLAQVVGKCLKYNTFMGTTDLAIVTATLEAMVHLDADYGEMSHLLIGMSMLSADKTVQSFAGELWIKGVSSETLNAHRLGEIIGVNQAIEFAPLKRLTDLLGSNLMNVSAKHNLALEVLLNEIIVRLPAKPVTNLRKLLEIYLEVISANGSSVPPAVLSHMRSWHSSGSLAKVLGSIGELHVQ